MARTVDDWERRLGDQARAERLRRRLSQADLARAANVSTQSISALENGAGSRLATVVAVARALGREQWLDQFAPVGDISPIELLREQQRRPAPRKRAPRSAPEAG